MQTGAFVAAPNCCDASQTPDVDEGLEDGWTAITPEAIDRAIRDSNGTITGIIIRQTCGAGGQTADAQLRESALAIEDRGLDVWLGCEDRWCGRHPELGGDSCGITPEHVRRNEHNACQEDRIRRCVAIADGIERVYFETGNELPLDTRSGSFGVLASEIEPGAESGILAGDLIVEWYDAGRINFDEMVRALPQAQPDLRAHEAWVAGQIRRWRPDAELVTNANTGEPIPWVGIHGDPSVENPVWFPQGQPVGPRTILSESSNRFRAIEQQIDTAQFLVDRGAARGWWRGVHTRGEAADRLDAISRVRPRPTPTPGPEPDCGPSSRWSCFEDPDGEEPDAKGAELEQAILAVMARRPDYMSDFRGPEGDRQATVHRDDLGRYSRDLVAELEVCAWEWDPGEILIQATPDRAVVWDIAQCDDPLYCIGQHVRLQPFDCTE